MVEAYVLIQTEVGKAAEVAQRIADIEGVTSVTEQVTIVRQKAGLTTEESAELYRFEVQRYR